MQRTTSAVVALCLVVSALAAVPFVMAQETGTEQATENATHDAGVAPGAQLSGIVAVGEAELDGDIEERAYGIRVARANSSDARAAVVADQLDRTDERIATLEQRRQALDRARENGTLSEGEYRARVAALHAESRTAQRMVNRTNETASELPAETLAANGVDVTAIRTLSNRAANLTGPETAAIARSIAGEGVGQPARPDAANNATSGADRGDAAGNRTSGGPDGGDSDTGETAPDGQGPAESSAGTSETTTPAVQG
ncbi:DUF7096 domain-containing protein [Haloarcula onubensis]|uniref:DUF7096 domain-containing protein n=1 Tax=Haloarcula onubensis TaxID=2950539 RepID=A0ABU2FP69_9EURY|nr:hypothetical protein [Halomicroarcula sp. S3CR25-11]MDS0282550.1 hypothetical protein [Halomicroarcula sp. S3CR25-11]